MELHCQHLSPSLRLYLTPFPLYRKQMSCSFYPDCSNKMTINGLFSASLRSTAIPLLSLHVGKQQYSATILSVSNFLCFCPLRIHLILFLWLNTDDFREWKKKKVVCVSSNDDIVHCSWAGKLHYPNACFWKVQLSWHAKAAVPIFRSSSLHFSWSDLLHLGSPVM